MKNNFHLKDLENDLKYFLIIFLATLGIGIFVGLSYVYLTTEMTPTGTVDRFNGSEVLENEIPEEFPKPIESMVLTTHDHVLNFAMISFLIGIIFYFNSQIIGRMKLFLMIEPFISTIITFGSLWLMRYTNDIFIYLVILSAIAMHICWYVMIGTCILELIKKNGSLKS